MILFFIFKEKNENTLKSENFPMNFLENNNNDNVLPQSLNNKMNQLNLQNKQQTLNAPSITGQNGPLSEKSNKYRGFLNRN